MIAAAATLAWYGPLTKSSYVGISSDVGVYRCVLLCPAPLSLPRTSPYCCVATALHKPVSALLPLLADKTCHAALLSSVAGQGESYTSGAARPAQTMWDGGWDNGRPRGRSFSRYVNGDTSH